MSSGILVSDREEPADSTTPTMILFSDMFFDKNEGVLLLMKYNNIITLEISKIENAGTLAVSYSAYILITYIG